MRKYLTSGEITCVTSRLSSPYNLIAKIQVWTGRRPSEVLLMKKQDIDHDKKMIEFIQLKKRGKAIDYPMGKGKYDRTYERKRVTKPIDCTAFYPLLKTHLDATHSLDYVFPSPISPNKHLSIRSLQKKVKKAGEMVNINVHPHMFRHSFAVQYLEKRINVDKIDPIQALYELKNILGHSSIDTTMGYLAYVTGKESLKDLWEKKEE